MEREGRRMERKKELSDLLDDLSKRIKIDNLSSFTDEMKVPADIYAALQSGRPELLMLLEPRALSAVEVKELFKVLAVLIDTNMALRDHTQHVMHFTKLWGQSFTQLESLGRRIESFANFDMLGARSDSED